MNGAFATKSPSGANRAQEKSRRSLILVLIEVCWSERPMASATLMKRFAKRVRRIGSGPLKGAFEEEGFTLAGMLDDRMISGCVYGLNSWRICKDSVRFPASVRFRFRVSISSFLGSFSLKSTEFRDYCKMQLEDAKVWIQEESKEPGRRGRTARPCETDKLNFDNSWLGRILTRISRSKGR